ncbi:MAG: hypothetical protein JRF56_17040 [Deltaproteobacteria bacterium]|nr:hypothetical protein [Deltaproteobacteria bacterium]
MLISFLEWNSEGGSTALAVMKTPQPSPAASLTLRHKIKSLPVPFLENQHRFDEEVLFYTAFSGNRFLVNSDDSLVYEFQLPNDGKRTGPLVLKEQLIGAKIAKIVGDRATALKVNQLSTRMPAAAGHQIPGSERLDLGRIYDGIRCQLRVRGGGVEKVFRVEPGADPNQIRVQLDGAGALKLTRNGEIAVGTKWGAITLSKPIAYQYTPAGRQNVAADYLISGSQYGFHLGAYDPTRELIIDPQLIASFLQNVGEFGGLYEPFAMVTDAERNLIIADSDFIRKISPNLDRILATASFILSGSWILDIALDRSGNLFIAGGTRLTDFSGIGSGSADSTTDNNEGFVAKVDADLTNILAATYLGGTGRDSVYALVIDNSGNFYAAGNTRSEDFPGVGSRSADPEIDRWGDGFVVKLDPDLSRILSATYLGRSDQESVRDIGLDSAGNVFVAGFTPSSDFPGINPASVDDTFSGAEGFIVKLDLDLAEILATTYLGGGSGESAHAVVVPDEDIIYVAGETFAADFPGIHGGSADHAFDGQEGFVAMLDLSMIAEAPGRIEEPPRRLEHESLFLIDCGPCPACFEGPCDPRVNPDWDKFVIWQPELEIARSFSRSAIGLRAQDGPIAAAAPIRIDRGEELFVVSVPYADAAKADVGAVFFLNGSGKTVARAYGRRKGERLGIDLAVYQNEVVAVSTRKIVRFENSEQIFEQPLTRGLKANQGLHVAFTADVDGDRKADIMLGAPFAKVGELEAAGLIQVVGSKSGQVINAIYGRVQGQHLGKILQPQLWNK